MRTADLTGPDLTYWVAKANAKGSHQEADVLRSHYGNGVVQLPREEPSMRAFVANKFGSQLPVRDAWR